MTVISSTKNHHNQSVLDFGDHMLTKRKYKTYKNLAHFMAGIHLLVDV